MRFRLSVCQIYFLSIPIRETISQVYLHLARLTSGISIFIQNYCVSDILWDFIFEKLMELSAFHFVLELLLQH